MGSLKLCECNRGTITITTTDAIIGAASCVHGHRFELGEGRRRKLLDDTLTRLEALETASEALITEHVVAKASPEILTSFRKKQQKRNRRNDHQSTIS